MAHGQVPEPSIYSWEMARTARKHSDSGVYHVILRGVNKQQIFGFTSVHFKALVSPYFYYSLRYSKVFPTIERDRTKSFRFFTSVLWQSLWWKERVVALRNSSSRKRWTWFSVSLISPYGDTLPGSNPKYLIILSGEANEILPHEGSPCEMSDSLSLCSR